MDTEAVLPDIDIAALPAPAQRLLDKKTPAPMRQLAAKGVAPGLRPHDALAVVVLLARQGDEADRATAEATLRKPPPQLLAGALTKDAHPAVLDAIAATFASDAATMEKILALPQLLPDTVARVAVIASEPVCELIAVNEQRLLGHPQIIEKLYMNKATRMSTADRIIELAVRHELELTGIPAYKEAAAAIQNELICEPQEEDTYDDKLFKATEEISQRISVDLTVEDTHEIDEDTGEEKVIEKVKPLHQQLAEMTTSQKIRRALLGTATERMLLVRDSNRLVCMAAIKSPAIQENEVVIISASRAVSDDVLRAIASDRDWTRSHQIKVNLVMNPRTPFTFAARLIQHLREHELKLLAKSKNVTGAVAQAAKQQLLRKQK